MLICSAGSAASGSLYLLTHICSLSPCNPEVARPLGPPQLDQRSRSRAEAAGRRISPGRLLTAGRCCGDVKRRIIPEQPADGRRFCSGCQSLGWVVRRWSAAFCPKLLLLRLLRLLVPESRASSHLPVRSTAAPAAAPSRRLPCKSPRSSLNNKVRIGGDRRSGGVGGRKQQHHVRTERSPQTAATTLQTPQCRSRCLSRCCPNSSDGSFANEPILRAGSLK